MGLWDGKGLPPSYEGGFPGKLIWRCTKSEKKETTETDLVSVCLDQ